MNAIPFTQITRFSEQDPTTEAFANGVSAALPESFERLINEVAATSFVHGLEVLSVNAPAWQVATLNTGVTVRHPTLVDHARLVLNNQVQLRLELQVSFSSFNDGYTMATLPLNCWPASDIYFSGRIGGFLTELSREVTIKVNQLGEVSCAQSLDNAHLFGTNVVIIANTIFSKGG